MSDSVNLSELKATRTFYDRISKAYDLLADASEQRARDAGLELLAARAGERVLEIGYGTGHAVEALARAVGAEGSVAGVDLSDGMHRVASERIAAAELSERVVLRVAAVPPLPFDDGSFDAAFLSFTLELFSDDTVPVVLSEVRRVTVQHGRLAVVAMNRPPAGERRGLMQRAYRFMHRHFPHIVDCRPIDVTAVLGRCGFAVERRVDLDVWTLPVCAVLARRAG